MELIDALHQVAQESIKASKPTDLVAGTVVSAAPLEISINPNMEPLKAQVLSLTANVVEKTVSNLPDSVCVENGETLPKSGSMVTINRKLAAGDKVLLLRVNSGGRYLVLSRVFEGG